MYQHAYHLDFGANASAYVAAFMRNIDWGAVQGRYRTPPRSHRPGRWSRNSSPARMS